MRIDILIQILKAMKKHLIFILALGFVFASCKKDKQPIEENLPQKMDNLQVPADFNWKTTTDFQFEVSSDLDGLLSVMDAEGTNYHKSVLKAGESYLVKLTLPTYLKSVQLKQMGRIKEVSLSGGILKVDF
jgi:hypothetical protein